LNALKLAAVVLMLVSTTGAFAQALAPQGIICA
jgi:hypothetical protein